MLAAKKSTLSDRLTFEKTKSEIEFPDLLGVQIEAFQSFIQENVPEDERENLGLQEVFTNVFPLEDPHRNYVFEYKSYFLGLAKYKWTKKIWNKNWEISYFSSENVKTKRS